jgi:hypothetical protein
MGGAEDFEKIAKKNFFPPKNEIFSTKYIVTFSASVLL